jgi:4-alpha-glucanotransferase
MEKTNTLTKPKKTISTKSVTESVKQVKKTSTSKKTAVKTNAKKTVAKKTSVSKSSAILEKITFQLRFTTVFGQELFIIGNHPKLGNGDMDKAIPLQFFNNEFWYATIELSKEDITNNPITYNYYLKNNDGTISYDCGSDKQIDVNTKCKEILRIDGWNYTGYIQNAFYTVPFKKVLLPKNTSDFKATKPRKITHTFQTKFPLIQANQTICILGSADKLGKWNVTKPILLKKNEGEDLFKADVDLSKETFPLAYKFGIYNTEEKKFIAFEEGDNRILYDEIKADKKTIVNDAFTNFPVNTWRGAGVAIPVFSLRSEKSCGVGEFTDMKLMVDWCNQVGLKLLQILPINDTIANHSWKDSYPYAAISAFALHPIYINLEECTQKENVSLLKEIEKDRIALNQLSKVDYEKVVALKLSYLKKIFKLQFKKTFESDSYKAFYDDNKHWLVAYAAFSYLRDLYKTSNFNNWPKHQTFNQKEIDQLLKDATASTEISFYFFVQYHLHLQLKAATQYAHSKGVVVKGDIPIGIYRYGVDAWQQPELYHLNVQAGAPPDDFAVKGQNWGFPTYNWEKMKADGFAWWKQRFEQMSCYFDTFRIDHILGFFRIWSIPTHAVEGIMGYFVPAIPIHINEIYNRNIDFNFHRFTQPFITESVLWDLFGYDNQKVKDTFLNYTNGLFSLKESFNTQQKVAEYFNSVEVNDLNNKLKIGLFNLISNVILFEVEGSNGQQFHFRFAIEKTSSFNNLDFHSQQQLKELYVDYFYKRQDNLWKLEALQKLPALRRVTNMLICGEDLGLVPDCVPDIMQQLGLLSLEIQRMPKANHEEFFHPANAPYLSVVTPSTHDMSTVRGWWEEDRDKTQRFYNTQLGQWGNAPTYCEPWINKTIIEQHLHSPAMWSIFQLQDILGIDAEIRVENPNEERINVPADPNHYWQYRMHIKLEDLIKTAAFNSNLKHAITLSGR